MKKKIIICVILVLVVIGGAIVLLGNAGANSDVEKGKDMSDFNKPVTEYTWEEFNDLKPSEQMEFQNSFDSDKDFEKWMNETQGNDDVELPWENGGKAPEEYTWDEFNDLSGPQQIRFQFAFDEEDGFDKWLQKAQKDTE